MSEHDSAVTPIEPSDETAAALERYRARMKRPRAVYAAVVAVVVLALGVVTVVAWTRGETNNTTSRTVAEPPDDLATGAPSTDPRVTWRTASRVAIGAPQWQGTVVVSDRHAVSGLDARTGTQTWTYRRSDRELCTAAQGLGVTIAVYRLRGNCDEVTGLDSSTGERRWTRTLDMDGMPVVGTPRFDMVNALGNINFVVQTSSVIYVLDSSGQNRWTYTRFGCRIERAVVGYQYGLVSQTCGANLRCGKLKFCFRGPQLFLLPNGFNRDDEKLKETNPDHLTWNRRISATPVSAGTLVSAADARGTTLLHLDAGSGQTTAGTPITGGAGVSTTTQATDFQYVTVGGVSYCLRPTIDSPRWQRAGVATVVATDLAAAPDPDDAYVTLATGTGAAVVDGSTGRVTGTYRISPGDRSAVYRLGTGFLVAGGSSTVAYS